MSNSSPDRTAFPLLYVSSVVPGTLYENLRESGKLLRPNDSASLGISTRPYIGLEVKGVEVRAAYISLLSTPHIMSRRFTVPKKKSPRGIPPSILVSQRGESMTVCKYIKCGKGKNKIHTATFDFVDLNSSIVTRDGETLAGTVKHNHLNR